MLLVGLWTAIAVIGLVGVVGIIGWWAQADGGMDFDELDENETDGNLY